MTKSEQILNDGAKQFAVLTGENLVTYARTFAALANHHLEEQAVEESNRLDDRALEAWNITQLSRALHDDLKACTCDLERQNCTALATIEIRALRDKIAASGRKFTPGECSVMDDLGISYQPWNAKAVVGLSVPA